MFPGNPKARARFGVRQTANRSGWPCPVVAGLLGLLFMTAASPAQTPPAEHQVKAAIVANLPKYVDWPSRAFVASNSPLVLEVIVPASLEAELRKMTAGRLADHHPLELRRVEPKPGELPAPHILFLSGVERKLTSETLRRYRGQPVLTVVEGEAGAFSGAIVTLVRKDNKIRLAIDVAAMKESGLAISSKLLGVADLVNGGSR